MTYRNHDCSLGLCITDKVRCSIPRIYADCDMSAKATLDTDAGDIICIIDALNECEELGRVDLIQALDGYYSNLINNQEQHTRLKFRITNRSYVYIERDFESLTSKYPTIRLAGEERNRVNQS